MLKHPVADDSTVPSTLATEVSQPAGRTATGSPLQLRMDYADPLAAVLRVTGDLDLDTAPRMAELLWSRLRTELPAIVIDLREVVFLGVAGLELVSAAHAHAQQHGIVLVVVSSTRAVDRALATGGLDTALPCFADLGAARRAVRTSTPAADGGASVLPL